MGEAKRSKSHLLFINILIHIENIGVSKMKLNHQNIALVCLMAIAGQEVGSNSVPYNMHYQSSEE